MKAKIGFVVYGTHRGVNDPCGEPFVNDAVIEQAKNALRARELELVVTEPVIVTKEEAKACIGSIRKDDSIDALVLFSGTWIWAAHLAAAVRDFAMTGKPIIVWTYPGSQGWRPVGGFVMHGALLEIGVAHQFVYASADEPEEIDRIAHYARAGRLRNMLNQSTIGAFGGRGMGQTCGVADPAQWMRVFGVDIDSRDTNELLEAARAVTESQIEAELPRLATLFGAAPELDAAARRSISLYLALKQVVDKNKFDFYTIQSFPGLGDDYAATCFAQSMMLEDGMPTSTLSDFNTAMTVYLLTYLSRERVYYGDLQHIDRAKKEVKIIGDGAVPPSLADPCDPAGYATHGIPTEGAAGGLSVKLTCKPGPCVLARLGRINGKFTMVLAKGSVFVPKNLDERKRECGIPFWPHAFVKVDGDIDALISNYLNEYGVLGYGEQLYGDLAAFCELMGIDLICA